MSAPKNSVTPKQPPPKPKPLPKAKHVWESSAGPHIYQGSREGAR